MYSRKAIRPEFPMGLIRTGSCQEASPKVLWYHGNRNDPQRVYAPREFLEYVLSAWLFAVGRFVGVSWW